MIKSLTYIFVLFIGITCIQGQNTTEKQRLVEQRASIKREIELATKLLKEAKAKRNSYNSELRIIQSRIKSRQKLIITIKAELSVVTEQIKQYESNIVKLQKQLQKQREEYAKFIRISYKHYNHSTIGLYLLASEDINQFYMRKKYFEQLANARKEKLESINVLIQSIDTKRLELQEAKEQLLADKRNVENEHQLLSLDVSAKEKNISAIRNREHKLKQELNAKEKLRKQLDAKIEEIIKAEVHKNRFAALTPELKLISTNFEKNKGRIPWPTVQGIITLDFGDYRDPATGAKINNKGVDITTVEGSDVRAVFDGYVSTVFTVKGANLFVIIRHGEYRTVYLNLTEVNVKVGDKVNARDVIGIAGLNDEKTNSLVRFQVWKGSEFVDPSTWLTKKR